MPRVQVASDVEIAFEKRGPSAFSASSNDDSLQQHNGLIPIIFHHGFTSSKEIWAKVVSLMEPDHPCITFDVRGCGSSSRPLNPEAYSIEIYAQDVIALANHLGVKKFIFVGHSMGGAVGLELALKFPEYIHRLILIAPVPSVGLRNVPKIDEYHARERQDRLDFATDPENTMKRLLEEHERTAIRPIPHKEVETLMHHYVTCSDGHFEGSWESILQLNFSRQQLRSIRIPTLMMAAQCDLLLASNLADYQSLGNAALSVFHRAGHSLQRELPQEVAAILSDFICHGVKYPPSMTERIVDQIEEVSSAPPSSPTLNTMDLSPSPKPSLERRSSWMESVSNLFAGWTLRWW